MQSSYIIGRPVRVILGVFNLEWDPLRTHTPIKYRTLTGRRFLSNKYQAAERKRIIRNDRRSHQIQPSEFLSVPWTR